MIEGRCPAKAKLSHQAQARDVAGVVLDICLVAAQQVPDDSRCPCCCKDLLGCCSWTDIDPGLRPEVLQMNGKD